VAALLFGCLTFGWLQFDGTSAQEPFRIVHDSKEVRFLAILRADASVCPREANAADAIEGSDTMLDSCHAVIGDGIKMMKILSLVLIGVGIIDLKTILNLRKNAISAEPA